MPGGVRQPCLLCPQTRQRRQSRERGASAVGTQLRRMSDLLERKGPNIEVQALPMKMPCLQ